MSRHRATDQRPLGFWHVINWAICCNKNQVTSTNRVGYLIEKSNNPSLFSVVGDFINATNVIVKVNLGEPFSYECPPRKHSYGVVYSWGNSDGSAHHTFARNERRSISSNGTLFIMYLTQDDIDEIASYKGIRCIISGANSFRRSGTLRLEKIDKDQKGNNSKKQYGFTEKYLSIASI